MRTNYNDDPEVVVRSYLALALLALVCVVIASIVAGFVFSAETGAVLLLAGMLIVPVAFALIILNERSHYHYRQNLREQAAADSERARAEMTEARTAALMASLKPVAPTARLMEPLPQASNPRIYVNGVERLHEDDDAGMGDDMLDDEDDVLAPPMPTVPHAPAPLYIESQAERAVRIRNLARAIYERCRDAEPTQVNIKARIAMTRGGLLRSNEDITDALDELSRAGMVSASGGKGVRRTWLHPIRRR